MDNILRRTLLYDFYSDLLTEKQRSVYEMYFLNDLSLNEIAIEYAVTPQAVRDILRRTDNNLAEYEAKLKLIDKHEKNQLILIRIAELTDGNQEIKSLVEQLFV